MTRGLDMLQILEFTAINPVLSVFVYGEYYTLFLKPELFQFWNLGMISWFRAHGSRHLFRGNARLIRFLPTDQLAGTRRIWNVNERVNTHNRSWHDVIPQQHHHLGNSTCGQCVCALLNCLWYWIFSRTRLVARHDLPTFPHFVQVALIACCFEVVLLCTEAFSHYHASHSWIRPHLFKRTLQGCLGVVCNSYTVDANLRRWTSPMFSWKDSPFIVRSLMK